MQRKRAEKIPFHSQHFGATESISTTRIVADFAKGNTAKINTQLDSTGDVVFSQSARRLEETASQTAADLGVDGALWIRAADSKLLFANSAGANVDVSDIGLGACLARGNGADGNVLSNVSRIDFDEGVRIGLGVGTAQAYAVNIGDGANSQQYHEVVVGHSASSNNHGSVVVGASSTLTTDGSVEEGIVLGGASDGYNDQICIGYNLDTTAVSGAGCVFVQNNSTKTAFITSDTVHIGDTVSGTPEANQSVVLGATSGGTGVSQYVVWAGAYAGTNETTSNTASVVIGANGKASNQGVSIGGGTIADATANATILSQGGACSGANAVVAGAASSAAAVDQVLLGEGNTGEAAAARAVVLGNGNTASHADAIVIGSDATSSVANEFFVPGLRLVYGSLASGVHTGALVASFPLTTAGSVVRCGGKITASTGANDTAVITLRDFHFRNLSGTASQLSNFETTSVSDPDSVGGFAATLALSGTTIELRFTCTTAAAVEGTLEIIG